MHIECFSQGGEKFRSIHYSITSREISNVIWFLENCFFRKKRLPNAQGLRIDLCDDREKERIEKPIKGIYPLVRCVHYFDYFLFMKSDSREKKKMIVQTLKQTLIKSANLMNWETEMFVEEFKKIDDLDLNFHYVTSKPKSGKGTKVKINIECEFEPGFYFFFLIITLPDGEIRRRKIVTLNSYYNLIFEHSRIISEAKWEDGNTYVVLGKKGHLERIRFEYKLDTDSIATLFTLGDDINKAEFMEEFELATTEDPQKIEQILNNRDFNKWHIYL